MVIAAFLAKVLEAAGQQVVGPVGYLATAADTAATAPNQFKIVSHGRYVAFQMAEVAIPNRHSADDRGTAAAARCIDSVMRSVSRIPSKTGGKVRLDDGKFGKFSGLDFGTSLHSSQTCPRRSGLANNHELTQSCLQSAFIWRMSV